MNINGIYVIYRIGNERFYSTEKETPHYRVEIEESDNRLNVVLIPKQEMYMLNFGIHYARKMDSAEKFFANGYQAWTTTREYGKNDTALTYLPLADHWKFARDYVWMCTDGRIRPGSKREKGVFHSFTYTYFRNNDVVEFWGSLTERQGFTIFDVDYNTDTFVVDKDIEGAIISKPYTVFDIVKFYGDYDTVFDKYFQAMGVKKPRIDHMAGYTSWYNYYTKISHEIILRDLDGLDRAKETADIFQIDDGYERCVGDWLETNNRFPEDMGFYAKKIHEKGYKAGLWLAPFNATKKSKTYKEHRDWVLKDEKGKEYLGCMGWGGAYTFDIYNQEFRAHLKHVFDVVCNKWGYDMVKLDFLYSQCMIPRAGKTRGEIMCDAMDLLRECVGDTLFLGCGVPLGPCFGIVDACRISCDVSSNYQGDFYLRMFHLNNEVPSAKNAINNSIFRRHLNGRVFVNDPDVFFLRDFNIKFTDEQKHLLAKVNNLCGDVLFVSDDIGKYGDKEVEAVKGYFKKSNAHIISAEYVTDSEIKILYTENETKKVLHFDIQKGKIIEDGIAPKEEKKADKKD